MPLKDYTTEKSPEQTISEIGMLLKDFGVKDINTRYDDSGNVVAMMFRIKIEDQEYSFKLPTDWRPVLQYFENDKKTPRHRCNEDQARRTAWRLVFHWVDSQLALVRIRMVELQTIFLPYIMNKDGYTLAERFKEQPNFLLS